MLPLNAGQEPFILVVDIGTSSLRAMVVDGQARPIDGLYVRREHQPHVTREGGAELDPAPLFENFVSALDELLGRSGDLRISAVAASTLAHNVLGADREGNPITPIYLYSDSRAAAVTERLRTRVDWGQIYARTGCPLHTGYLPERLLWFSETYPALRPERWLSLHEWILFRLFGRTVASQSYASWTGMLNRERTDWDEGLLALVQVDRGTLSPIVPAGESLRGMVAPYRQRWPALAETPFFPAIGDGAAAHLGSGCIAPACVSVTAGTSAAVRVVLPASPAQPIPDGLWLYTVDERRALLGGSLNNAGDAYDYLHGLLQRPPVQVEERELSAMPPDSHGLTILPFFSGERSPGYHGNARASIVGLSLNSSPDELVRAAIESVAFRLAVIYRLVLKAVPGPEEIIASGSSLLRSPTWAQILADVLNKPVTLAGNDEPSAVGAALMAQQALGVIPDVSAFEAPRGRTFLPDAARHEKYELAMTRHQNLYERVMGGWYRAGSE
ncbi:MAG: gluconokinase [Rudaea sp.]